MPSLQLAVNEIFGPTFQGEGPSIGKEAVFLRLAMCNLKCSWCDTKYTWDWAGEFGPPQPRDLNIDLHTPQDLAQELFQARDNGSAQLLVISGGEPMLQQKGIEELFFTPERLSSPFNQVEIETNGTVMPNPVFDIWPWVKFNCSPKLVNSNNPLQKRFKLEVLQAYNRLGARFKFVVQHLDDLAEVEAIVSLVEIPSSNVWIMPEGTDSWTIMNRTVFLSEEVLKRGWNLTTRMHVLLWGDQRGR